MSHNGIILCVKAGDNTDAERAYKQGEDTELIKLCGKLVFLLKFTLMVLEYSSVKPMFEEVQLSLFDYRILEEQPARVDVKLTHLIFIGPRSDRSLHMSVTN